MRHWCIGQFRRVSSHIHRTVDSGYSVWGTFGNFSCCSSVFLLPETFAADETSKQRTHKLKSVPWNIILDQCRRVSTLQGYNARRLLEPDDGELDNNQSDCVSNSRKEAPSGTPNEKVFSTLSDTHFSLRLICITVTWRLHSHINATYQYTTSKQILHPRLTICCRLLICLPPTLKSMYSLSRRGSSHPWTVMWLHLHLEQRWFIPSTKNTE